MAALAKWHIQAHALLLHCVQQNNLIKRFHCCSQAILEETKRHIVVYSLSNATETEFELNLNPQAIKGEVQPTLMTIISPIISFSSLSFFKASSRK